METHDRRFRPPSLKEIRARLRPVRNVNEEHEAGLSKLDRLAIFITDHVGTMGFFFIIFAWTVLWLSWNFLAPKHLQFDPPMAFVFWLFISNMVQIFLMPLIMIGQNIQGKHSELRAQNDFEVNVKAEHEIEVVLHHLEFQNALLITMLEKLGVSREEAVKQLEAHGVPETPAAAA